MANKRILTPIFLAAMLLALAGFCAAFAWAQGRPSSSQGLPVKDYPQLVQTVQRSLKKHDWRIVITFQSENRHMEDISLFVQNLMDDAFAIADTPDAGDYLKYQSGGYTLAYQCEAAGSQYHYTVDLMPVYFTKPAQEEQVDAAVAEILELLGLREDASDYDKVKAIYDYLYATVDYDEIHKSNENYHLDCTAYNALVYHSAGCQGYSVAAYRLLREVGVDCRIVTGEAVAADGTAEFHAWNLVRIDGKYYNLDITWNKQMKTDRYFLRCDRSFADHVRDAEFDTAAFRAAYPMALLDYGARFTLLPKDQNLSAGAITFVE